jgi:hypothetical protein
MDCSGLRDDFLDVLYGEAKAETRRRVDAHVAACPSCRDELSALQQVRTDLQGWKAPEMRPFLPRRPGFRPPMLLAAAAALLLVTGAVFGAAGSELRYEEGRWSFRLGRASSEATIHKALEAQEARHRQELAELRALLTSKAGLRPAAAPEEDERLLRRVAEMIRDSEQRQSQRVEASLSGLADRAENRRRYDLARIGAGLAYLDGKNGQHLSRTTELMGYVLEASQQRGEK